MASRTFSDIGSIYSNSHTLSSLKNTCDYLKQLNQVLHQCLPEKYASFCHFGALDENNKPILFVTEQPIFHIVRTMSNHILRSLSCNNFEVDGILIKVKHYPKPSAPVAKYKRLPQDTKNSLKKLATLINKTELLVDNPSTLDNTENKEINF